MQGLLDELKDIGFIDAHEWCDGKLKRIRLPIIQEYAFVLKVNGYAFASMAYSGKDLRALVHGFLASERIIRRSSDIASLDIDLDSQNIDVKLSDNEYVKERLKQVGCVLSGCAQGLRLEIDTPSGDVHVSLRPSIIIESMKIFLSSSDVHRLTGGVHSAALFSLNGSMICCFDDVGRHNAIDKVIGHALLGNIELSDKMLFTTGRLSADIVKKAVVSGIPVLVSRASPTIEGIQVAQVSDLVMIARVRTRSFQIFSGKEHLTSNMGE